MQATAHCVSAEEVCKKLGVVPKDGLSSSQVEKLREQYGYNELPQQEGTPFWKLVIRQFEDTLVRILLLAAIISFVLALVEGHHEEEGITAFLEPAVILMILIANAVVGVWQESNAEKAIEALKAYEAPTANVIRDSKLQLVPARELVPGDIIEIAVGERIPADVRMIQAMSTTIRVDQSILTGEVLGVQKVVDVVSQQKIELQGKINTLFSGTTVTYGKCRSVVVGIGKDTEIGKIQKGITETEEEETPLQKKLDEFAELLSKVISVICVLVWLVNIGHFTDPEHGNFLRGAIYYFKIAVALAVAAIPEGLPAVVTTCLALGTRRMAKKNAIIRSLPSVETLGCTTIICSDKTGTLTTNMMSVAKVLIIKNEKEIGTFDVQDTGFNPVGNMFVTGESKPLEQPTTFKSLAEVAKVCALSNDSSLSYNDQTKQTERMGEATEAALRVLAEKIGLPDAKLHQGLSQIPMTDRVMYCNKYWEKLFPKRATLEFSRSRKSMSAYCDTEGQKRVLFVKGAPEAIIERCDNVYLNDGSVVPFSKQLKEIVLKKTFEFSTGVNTLRCLGLAIVPSDVEQKNRKAIEGCLTDPDSFVQAEQNMTFVGVAGMLDPPRAEVADAIEKCKTAGIRVIVITGDNKATAESICKRIGVFEPNENTANKAYTGAEFDALTPQEQNEAVNRASLFCRVEPAHKIKLVDLLQKQHQVVAMTGDGVNDAQALKKADIGIAMGSGTAVARGASKMVLRDDNFSTIVSAVEEGRAIYSNTKQFIRYLISSNIGEVVCIFLTAALGMPEALIPVQLLWVNLVTDGLPATALGFNPADKNIMLEKPRDAREPIINGWLFFRYLVIGVYVGLATVAGAGWWFMFYESGPQMSFYELTHFSTCASRNAIDCSVFHLPNAPTVALSVLVVIEMFNALNAVSENESIISVPPFKNMWLIGAIALSLTLHFVILYVPVFSTMFNVTALTSAEWKGVLMLSFPVILIDECLKFFTRNYLTHRVAASKVKRE